MYQIGPRGVAILIRGDNPCRFKYTNMIKTNNNNEPIGGAATKGGSSNVSGRSGVGEGECSAPTGPGAEPNQTSSEGVTAKQGSTRFHATAENITPCDLILRTTCAESHENEQWKTVNRKVKDRKETKRK